MSSDKAPSGAVQSLSGRKVLVTGAGGFIGSHLVERLVELGAEVRAMVHYNALGSRGWLNGSPSTDRIEVVAGDLADAGSVSAAVQGQDVVLHLGALIGIPYSYVAPESYVRINVVGTLNILTAARAHGVSRVVHTSTSEVYGSALSVPISEEHPLQGQSPYSATKIGADKLAESFYRSFELPVVTLRPFNTFGPRQSTRAVIPTIIGQALSLDEVRLGNLQPTRDLTFVSDTVEGFVAAATAPGIEGETINLGTGEEISVGDLARLIMRRLDRPLRIVEESERTRPKGSEVDRLVSDNRKARERLDWAPQVSLTDGIDRTIAFLRANMHLYNPGAYTV